MNPQPFTTSVGSSPSRIAFDGEMPLQRDSAAGPATRLPAKRSLNATVAEPQAAHPSEGHPSWGCAQPSIADNATVSEGGHELESDLVVCIRAHTGPPRGFPQERVTNLGRRVRIDVAAEPDRYVFTHGGDLVAELHPPVSPGQAAGSLLGWRLTIPESSDRMLASPADDPPVGAALFFVDTVLRDRL